MSDFSRKQKWLAITPKPFSILSMLGSIFIIKGIVTKRHELESFHRILLGLSIWDLATSCAVFMGTWPIPKGTPGVFMASGTEGTCAAQGFFIQNGVGTPLYNASLSVHYFLAIVMGWEGGQMRTIEPLLHLVPAGFSLGTAITVAATGQYANSNVWCWITSSNTGFRMGLFYGPVWFAMAIATLSMVAICGKVIMQERRTRKYRQPERTLGANRQSSSSSSRKVASQAVFYVLSFYLTFVFPSWTRVSQMLTGSAPWISTALFSIFFPCQGLFNCMVYFRPRIIKYRQRHPDLNIFQVVYESVISNVQRDGTSTSNSVQCSKYPRRRNTSITNENDSAVVNDSAV